MAHKRMFSKDITTSDAFREMPPSSQALYFHLGMEADDDGFLDNYRGLMRAINASDDDLRILLSKRFLIIFPSKIVVVKHWLINNTVRVDRYHETKHLEEKKALVIKENGAYTETGIPLGNQMATEYRIGEDRKEDFAEPKSLSSQSSLVPLSEVKLNQEGEEVVSRQLPKKDKVAWALMQKLVDMLDKQVGTKPVTGVKEYVGVQRALKSLKETEIVEMVQDAIDDGTAEKKGLSIAAMLSNIEINRFRLRQ